MNSSPSAALPRGIIVLGFVSLLMDLSSETIHSVLPVFLVSVLGAGTVALGLVEGVAEAVTAVVRVFSGSLSDWFGRRKPLVLAGYGLAALAKPLFPLAQGVGTVLTARVVDRVGKGIRGAPRDAMVADLAPAGRRAAAYGLRQAMDTVGACLGPLAALGMLGVLAMDLRTVLWVASLPAVACVALIAFGLREPAEAATPAGTRRPPLLQRRAIAGLPRLFWLVAGFTLLLGVARFSEAFLILRGTDVGLDLAMAPLVLVVMNLVYALSAYPLGRLADRHGRRPFVLAGVLVLVAADLVLAEAATPAMVLAGAALWGFHMGATQGLLAAVTADVVPAAMRGTAFGLLNLAGAAAVLAGNTLAGWLWAAGGAALSFRAGAGCAALAAMGLLLSRGRRQPASGQAGR